MISKITKLTGVGTLHAPLAQGALTLKAKTIIFGENGRGKTTFVALLRSLASGDTLGLRQRKTIKGTLPQTAQVLVGQQPHDLVNGTWSKSHCHICVFDATFVSENVYSGSSVDPDQRKNLFGFALGSTGVALAREVDRLAAEIASKRSEETVARTVLSRHITGNITAEQFCYLTPADDAAIAELEKLKSRRDAINRAATIRSLQTPSPIPFSGLSRTALAEALGSTVDVVSTEAAERMRSHILSSHVAESWLEQGASFNAGDSCPYCAQDTRGNELVEAYKASFSSAYKDFRSLLLRRLSGLLDDVSAEKLSAIKATVEGNRAKVIPWREFLPELDLAFDLDSCLAALRSAASAARDAVNRKLETPLEPVMLSANELAALDAGDSWLTVIDDYNAKQVEVNAAITALRNTVEAGNAAAINADIQILENRVGRKDPDADGEAKRFLDIQAERGRLEGQKASARKTLDTHTASVVGQYKDAINRHLQGCGTAFQITELKTVYTGAKPRFDYAIELFGAPVDLANKPGSPVIFDSALSLGDKSALAFAFFLAKLESEPLRSEQIVVFDDPLSSLDSCRRRYTRKQIAALASQVAQLIVLTHEEATVADIAERLREQECAVFTLAAHGDFSIFNASTVKDITASEYARAFQALSHFLYGTGKPEDVVKVIRPFLELNLRYRFPEDFGPTASLGGMIGQIRSADVLKPLSKMNKVLPQLEDINEYATKHSHGDDALVNAETIVASELRLVVASALDFARGLPSSEVVS